MMNKIDVDNERLYGICKLYNVMWCHVPLWFVHLSFVDMFIDRLETDVIHDQFCNDCLKKIVTTLMNV